MAEIVFGFAASHTPMLALEAQRWSERADDDRKNASLNLSDGRYVTYEELARETGERYAAEATEENFLRIEAASQRALDHIADRLHAVAPDVVLIVGDDQGDMFSVANMPAISIYYGSEIVMRPRPITPKTPTWLGAVLKGYAQDAAHVFPGAPELSLELISTLIDNHVDIGACSKIEDPNVAGFGHAFGFIIRRLFRERPIPVVPVLLNTYFKPNAPRAARCVEIGRKLARILRASPRKLRVAVGASGGLSHFVVDEPLDRQVLEAIKRSDLDALAALPKAAFNSGSSEILNWILTAALCEGLNNDWSDYYPARRTPAGTGTGVGFATWT